MASADQLSWETGLAATDLTRVCLWLRNVTHVCPSRRPACLPAEGGQPTPAWSSLLIDELLAAIAVTRALTVGGAASVQCVPPAHLLIALRSSLHGEAFPDAVTSVFCLLWLSPAVF